jgi:ribose 5-phosphate isomerase A
VPLILAQLKDATVRQKNGKPFVSDNGNTIVDWKSGPIDNPSALEKQLKTMTGVVDSGIFAGVANSVIVAGQGFGIRYLNRTDSE